MIAGVMLASCNKDDVVESGVDNPGIPEGTSAEVIVYEYMPAPGQFINETSSIGGMTEALLTMEDANEWAEERLNNNMTVSLGAFGGYIVMGLDHKISAGNADYDFYVGGNAFLSSQGGSNEPGVVWVMQDTNGNGRPDDIWYELEGSETHSSDTKKDFAVTYYRPEVPGMDTQWKASDGSEGVVKYLAQFHSQDYYYPAWVKEDSYTLTGTSLATRNSQNPETGYWNNAAYEWGYADNIGSDNITGGSSSGVGQRNGFKISNAIKGDGSKANLDYINFVKIQTGVLANSGALGEISTEVCSFGEYK